MEVGDLIRCPGASDHRFEEIGIVVSFNTIVVWYIRPNGKEIMAIKGQCEVISER